MADKSRWSGETYDSVTRKSIESDEAFLYTSSAKASGRWEAHEGLKVLVDDGQGKRVPVTRECRDSDMFPVTTPIVIGFDVTGSMGDNPKILQASLKGLMGMLDRKAIVDGPQIAIGAYGDTHCDSVPVQLSQFESDNRIDENLDNVFLEGRGGPNPGETSAALAWFVAKHVITDAWEKRGKRGYMFLIGDECTLEVSAAQARDFLGEESPRAITPKEAFSAAEEMWDTYFLLIDNFAAESQNSRSKYEDLLGKNHVITLQSTESAPAVIASVIALAEGTMGRSEMASELEDAGFSHETAIAAVNATSKVGDNSISKADASYADLGL